MFRRRGERVTIEMVVEAPAPTHDEWSEVLDEWATHPPGACHDCDILRRTAAMLRSEVA